MNNTGLPKRIKELRTAHNLKAVEVASALNITRQAYSHYEKGDRVPNSEMLYKLAAFYNISVSDLLRETVNLDPEVFYDSPGPSELGESFDDYLEYLNKPENQIRLKSLNPEEKRLIYYYDSINSLDRWEIIEFIKILAHKRKQS